MTIKLLLLKTNNLKKHSTWCKKIAIKKVTKVWLSRPACGLDTVCLLLKTV